MSFHKRLFWILLLLLPTQLGFHLWPEWAYVLGRRIDYLSPTLYLTDILIVFILCVWTMESFTGIVNHELRILKKKKRIHFFPISIPYSVFSILLVAFIGANIAFASSPPVAAYKWVKLLEFVGLGWYIIQTKPGIGFLRTPLLIGVAYSSLLAISQFALQHSVGSVWWFLGERTITPDTPGIARFANCLLPIFNCQLLLRPYATFPHPNVLGGFLAVTLPLFMTPTFPKRQLHVWKWTVIVLGTIAIILTFSRSAWGVFAVSTAIVAALLRRSKRNALVLLSFALVMIGLTVFFRPLALDESVTERSALNTAAITLWLRSPTVGAGLGNFLVDLPGLTSVRHVNFLQPAHNIYLLVLSESGVVGLGVFLIVLGYGIWQFLARPRPPLLVSFIAILLLGVVDHYPVTLQQGQILLTLITALAYSRNR